MIVKYLPKIAQARLLFSKYSYTSSSWFPSIQHPKSYTRFRCCKAYIMPISFTNSRFPCLDLAESCFTAITTPSDSTPYTQPQWNFAMTTCDIITTFTIWSHRDNSLFPFDIVFSCGQLAWMLQNTVRNNILHWYVTNLVDRSKSSFSNLIFGIKVAGSGFDLS